MVKAKTAITMPHGMPADLNRALNTKPAAVAAWGDLTKLSQNEWICWNITVKQEATRKSHIERTVKELQEGKRRPCCWMGCPHRTDKPINATQKWMLGKQAKSK